MKTSIQTLNFHVDGYLVERRAVAMVELEPGERVRDAIAAGVQAYGGDGEMYAFVRVIPTGAQEFAEVEVNASLVTVVQASWVPAGAVAVGRGGQAVRPPVHTGAQKYMEVADG